MSVNMSASADRAITVGGPLAPPPSLMGVRLGVVWGVAVAKGSERFQAGGAGRLSGFTFSGLRNDGSLLSKATHGVHVFVDEALRSWGVGLRETLHTQIDKQVPYI